MLFNLFLYYTSSIRFIKKKKKRFQELSMRYGPIGRDIWAIFGPAPHRFITWKQYAFLGR